MDPKIPLINATDLEILMHKQVHFGGSFDVMIKYYADEGVGSMPDFSIARIEALKEFEAQKKEDLLATIMPDSEKERLESAKQMYIDLRDVYQKYQPGSLSILLSDLILSESENPKEEIMAVAALGNDAVPSLIDLVSAESFYDPLYPGYGRVPILAAKCLAKIGDKRALQPLFEALGQENFFTDDGIIQAIQQFGNHAKEFLLKVLKHEPLSKDNEHAAVVLSSMGEDAEIAKECLTLLRKKKPFFSHYLVFACSGLEDPSDRKEFAQMATSDHLSNEIKNEIKLITKNWSI